MVKLPVPFSFDWDEGNVEKNWKRHKVHYKEAEEVFFNRPLKIFEDIKHSQKEERFVGLGITNRDRKLNLVFNIRNNRIRVISARDQSKKERGLYAKKSD